MAFLVRFDGRGLEVDDLGDAADHFVMPFVCFLVFVPGLRFVVEAGALVV